ncbi:hypothetical protein BH23BAC1_BH23BAC1_35030 [soil metagenome]
MKTGRASFKEEMMKYFGKISLQFIICFFFSFYFLAQYSQAKIKEQSEELPDTGSSIYVENLDKFPANDRLTFAKIHIPWTRDNIIYNANHEFVTIKITNNGNAPLIINNFQISNPSFFSIDNISGGNSLPITLNTRQSVNVTVKFIAGNQNTRVRILNETLSINSNDIVNPSKVIYLHGLWQRQGEDVHEPSAQEIINAFGFKTNTGFGMTDPHQGDPARLKGDEVISPYFVRADVNKPIYVRQMAAYHGCCNDTETLRYFIKGSGTRTDLIRHHREDGQTLLPRLHNSSAPAEKEFSPAPTAVFGFAINADYTDRALNTYSEPYHGDNNRIGVRIWKVKDPQGNIVPNAYIIGNDYLGGEWTNYDYNDNLYYISNIRPEVGSAHFSELISTPSALKFGEKEIGSTNSLSVNLKSIGKTYNPEPNDPVINITSVQVVGQNADEFIASNPASSNINPQTSTNLSVQFKPLTGGIKNAELLIHYNFSLSPLRIPLYGIASNDCNIISNLHRIKSGSNSDININGFTWKSDAPFRKGNTKNDEPAISEIAGTDDDQLYIKYLSSTGDLNVIRYEIPVQNGELMVRLHFSENFWTSPGERVFSVKIENITKLLNFDILREVKPKTAYVRDFKVTVSDEVLNIDFSPSVNRLSIAAVEVYNIDNSGGPTINTIEVLNASCDVEDGSIKVAVASGQSATFKLGASGTYQASGTFSNLAPGNYVVFARIGSESCEVSKEFEITAEDCPNNPPVVTNPIADQSVREGTAFSFTFPENTFTDPDVGDELTYSATLQNNANLPFWLNFNASTRTFSGTPGTTDVGTIDIKVVATDGSGASVDDSFVITVTRINDPSLSIIPDQTTDRDVPIDPIEFTIDPGDQQINSLSLSALSDDEDLIPVANISFGGSGTNRTVSVAPAPGKSGIATISIVLNGNNTEFARNFKVTVINTNSPPTISEIEDISIALNTSTGPITFNIFDEDNDVNSLILTGSSENNDLVSAGNIVFGGSGENRTVSITPNTDQSGSALITITVSDGELSSETTFNLEVNPVTSIDKEVIKSIIELYPNPAYLEVRVKIENNIKGITQLAVIDTRGKILKVIQLDKRNDVLEHNIDLTEFASGAYIIKISQNEHSAYKKIIKY